ncbi:MAG: Uma2 family endonuclease [Flavisolibacter sp.]
MALPASIKHISIQEYLEAEELSVEKHEYYAGEVFAMAGAGYNHNLIVRNSLSSIDNFLKGKSCNIFPSDLKVHIEANSLFTYPDLSVICGDPQFWNGRTDTVLNPSMLIEVLSKSTQQYDRLEKFHLYREIPSLKEYVIIYSWEMRLEQYVKKSPNEWLLTEFKLPDEQIKFNSIELSIALQEFYRDVDFTLETKAAK